MCQATAYLDGEKIMEDVMMVELTAEGVCLAKLFEPLMFIPAKIQKIDLMKHLIILVTTPQSEVHK